MLVRWLFSSNAKDIGFLYLIFAIFSGTIGTSMSVLIRAELATPGTQILSGDYQLYNVLISAHAILMIFLCDSALTIRLLPQTSAYCRSEDQELGFVYYPINGVANL